MKLTHDQAESISIRLPGTLAKTLATAMKATGSSKTDLIIACILEGLPTVVNKKLEALKVGQNEWARHDGEKAA